MISRLIGVLMLLEAGTFTIASLIHFDLALPLGFTTLHGEPFTGAAIPEAIIAAVLLAGAIAYLVTSTGGWGLALGTSLFALAGVIVGLSFILRGPSRPGDLIYHLSILVALLFTIGLLLTPSARPQRRMTD
jgi:hypothetical protein